MKSILSGEQLVHAHSKTNHELPTAGVKEFQPTGSWLEGKQIQNILDQRKALLEEERVEKWSNLMGAEWLPEKGKAEVTQKSKHWEVYGHHCDNKDWLLPEEALFLMEINCLECVYHGVPLSIQRGYTVLLRPESREGQRGCCSLNEFRVFAHLCRMGYRLVRHLPDLTVTAYERKIRLDQHIDQPKISGHTASVESDIPKPDLPQKKSLDLLENTEITFKCSSVPSISLNETNSEDDFIEVCEVSPRENQVVQRPIEIIDIADSSPGESSEESSSDSDIEIIDEPSSVSKGLKTTEIDDNDDDVEIIEVPVVKKEIVVATIESSDSEAEKESSESGTDKSYDGNWKRNRSETVKAKFIRPATMSNLCFLAVEEFCKEYRTKSKDTQRHENLINGESNEKEDLNVDSDNTISMECISNGKCNTKEIINKTRNEILNLIPTMAGQSSKIMTLQCPDLRLIPFNLRPKQQLYTFNTNSLRAKVFSTFRGGFRGRRFFHGPRPNTYNNYYNANNNNFYPNHLGLNINNALLTNPPLTQMFGSDIHSMARGMMQFASALLLNIPQPNQNNGLTPFNSQPSPHMFNSPGPQSGFNPSPLLPLPPRTFVTPNHHRFSDSSFTPPDLRVANENVQQPLQHIYRGTDISFNSRSSGVRSDFDSTERNYTPPMRRGRNTPFNRGSHCNNLMRPLRGNHFSRTREFPPKDLQPVNSNLRAVDPAYAKPDVPLPDQQLICGSEGTHTPNRLSDENPVEVIDIADNTEVCRNTKRRFNQRLRKRTAKRRKFENKFCKTKGQNQDPVIIFIDGPCTSGACEDSVVLKQEKETPTTENIKTEGDLVQNSSVKEEKSENCSELDIKREVTDDIEVKSEICLDSIQETTVKSEVNNELVPVKREQEESETNVEVKIENSTDTFLVSGLSTTALMKTETETSNKTELDSTPEVSSTVNLSLLSNIISESLKAENIAEDVESKDDIIQNIDLHLDPVEMDTSRTLKSELDLSEQNSEIAFEVSNKLCDDGSSKIHEIEESSEMEVEIIDEANNSEVSRTLQNKCVDNSGKSSSWAEIKKQNVPGMSYYESPDEDENHDEESDEIQPLIRPKNCKTIGTVLSALQIFSPFSPEIPEDIPRLKISYDMYLPSDFRKTQRGLPQYRIVVFGGMDPLPSPAQLHELQQRFEDSVPVLRAVVMPDSVVFYACSNISLPVDLFSYRE